MTGAEDTLVLYSDGWSESINEEPASVLARTKTNVIELAESLAPEGILIDDLTLITLQRSVQNGV